MLTQTERMNKFFSEQAFKDLKKAVYDQHNKELLNSAIKTNNTAAMKVLLDVLNIPENLTLKERITYYQLLN